MTFNAGSGAAVGGGMVITIGIWILAIIVHIAFCIGVHRDAKRIRTLFVGPGMWAFATLLGGVFTAVAYWVVHHSSLVVRSDPNAEPSTGERF